MHTYIKGEFIMHQKEHISSESEMIPCAKLLLDIENNISFVSRINPQD